MKIVINRGFDKMLTRIAVFRNGQEIMACPTEKDYCVFDAEEGDRIAVKLRFLNTSALTIASWTSDKGDETRYISLTGMGRRWESANYKILPYLSLLSLALRPVMESDGYDWFCAGMVVLTALSLVAFQYCMLNASCRKKLFKLDRL